ncbi:MAG: hypothetical protein Q8S20_21600 [Sulfuritalea sp.]|nr:hypothetical protein [Sulfuritalea sp.]
MGYELIWEPHGVIKRFVGEVTDADISASIVVTHGDERFDSLRYIINDFLGGTERSVPPAAIEEIVAIEHAASISNPRIRIALVAADADFVEMADQYAGSALKAYPTRIFSSLDEARTWLDA